MVLSWKVVPEVIVVCCLDVLLPYTCFVLLQTVGRLGWLRWFAVAVHSLSSLIATLLPKGDGMISILTTLLFCALDEAWAPERPYCLDLTGLLRALD